MKLFLFLFAVAAVTMAEEQSIGIQRANDRFTSNMFSEVVKGTPDKSVVISAYSVLTPLAQLSLASEGPTHDELLKAIGMPNNDAIKQEFSQAERGVTSVEGVDFKTASKIYVSDKFKLNSNFAKTVREVFHSDVQNVDFGQSTKTAHEINDWVEDHTNKKIKDLVNPTSLNEATSAVLVNAIYFKGLWEKQFTKEFSHERPFFVTKEKTVNIPMMYQKSEFKYADVPLLDAKVLQMFYKGRQASMVFVLPNKIDGITNLEEKMKNPAALNMVMSQLRNVEVEVTIPKFKIETETDLKDILTKMGVTKIFNTDAGLTNLIEGVSDGLYISDAIQKAFIEVNEEGAEGAAANIFAAVATSLIIDERQPEVFLADRPFYYEIRSESTPIFNGVMVE